MENPNFIKSWCRITNEKLICDGKVLLERKKEESIGEFLKEIYRNSEANYPKFFKMDLLCKSAFVATEWIGKKVELFETNTALLLSNKTSSWVSDLKHAQSIYDQESLPSPAVFVYTLPNISLGEISIRHKLMSENLFLIFENFSPKYLIPYSNQMIREEKAEKVLSGWVEVNEDNLDIFIYLVDKEGKIKHTLEDITNLYLLK